MDYAQKRELILKGNMTRAIFALALPLMLSNFIQTIYNLTDTYWVSKIGSIEVAAIILVWPVIFFFMSLGMGVNIAGTALISQYIGSKQRDSAEDVAGQILTFSIMLSVIFALTGFILAPIIIKFIGGEGELLDNAVIYLRIIFIGMPFMFGFFAFNSIKHAQGDTLTPMILSGVSVFLNIILDPIFIFVWKLGIAGAAYATIIARCLITFYAISTLFTRNQGIKLKLKHLHLKKDILAMIIKVGLPSSIGQSATALGFMILNKFVISYGDSTLAAFGIGNRINSLVLMPAMGIGNALATIVGQNLGADQIERAKIFIRKSILLATLILSVGGYLMYLYSPLIIKQFSNDPEVLTQGAHYLKFICLTLPYVGIYQVFVGIFQGSGHTISAMILLAGRLWGLRIPLIIAFKNATKLGSTGIWYAMVLSNLLICMVGFIMYLSGNWQNKVIKKKNFNLEEIEEVI